MAITKKRKHTKEYLLHRQKIFCQLQKPSEIFDLLGITPSQYQKLTDKPQYHSFKIGKKSGGERQIETPHLGLKKIQEKLSSYLQAVYYFYKTPLAYGFVLNIRKDPDPRDILSNARKHLQKPYLINLDLEDFFHSVKVPDVWKIFGQSPFRFQRETIETLTRLVTYRNRLPMGASTSPVLSNFAMRHLDLVLYDLAEQEALSITRYADDISISSDEPISEELFKKIQQSIETEAFVINQKKVKHYLPEDIKEVTGILLKGDALALPERFLPELNKEIEQFAAIMLVQNQQGKLNTAWVGEFKKRLQGKINFLGYVLGQDSTEKKQMIAKLQKASYPPPDDFGSHSWRSFHYHI